MKIRYSALTEKELRLIVEQGNLTEDQRKLLLLLARHNMSDPGAMAKLNIAGAKYYTTKAELTLKVLRTLFAQEGA